VINDAVAILKPLNVPISQAMREYADASRILAGHGSISEAAHFFIQERRKGQICPIKFQELVEKFLKSIADNSYRYRQDAQTRLRLAVKAFSMDVQDITTAQVDEWLFHQSQR